MNVRLGVRLQLDGTRIAAIDEIGRLEGLDRHDMIAKLVDEALTARIAYYVLEQAGESAQGWAENLLQSH